MKVLILGASGFLGGILYRKLKEETDFWMLGTYFESKSDKEFIKLNVTNFIEVRTFLEHFNADVIVWCLMGKANEKELIEEGLPNILNNIGATCKFIFMSTNAVFGEGKGDFSEGDTPSYKSNRSSIAVYSNAKIDGEKLVGERENYVIIRTGIIYGQDINGKWDKRISQLAEEISEGKTVVRANNLVNTFVEVNELAHAIIKLIILGYKGIIHLGPERKQSYYEHSRNMIKKLNLDETLLLSNNIEEHQAMERGIILDASLNTGKCRKELGLSFSTQ